MKFLAMLLCLIYIVLATFSAPILHFRTTITVHDPSNGAYMDEHNASSTKGDVSDIITRCLQAASFFSTAIPSHGSLILQTISVFLVLIGSVILGFGSTTQNLLEWWKLTALGRSYRRDVLYLAFRPFKEWFSLFTLSPNFVAAADG